MKFIALIAIIAGLCAPSPAAPLRLEGKIFRPSTNAEIVWAATNAFPHGLWIYKVMPEAFSAAVVSNAMALGHFQMKDLSKTGQPLFHDKYLLYFWNTNEAGRPRFLFIAPTLGAMKYASQPDSKSAVEGVPTSEEAVALARDVLFQLGIDRSLLADRVRVGYDETRTKIDREGHKLGEQQVVSRGVSFERRVDGVPLSENWCFLIHFGRQGRIDDFSLRWRNLVPAESHALLTPAQLVQKIQSAESVLPPQYSDTSFLETAKNLNIVKATPRYYNGAGNEPLDFLIPYADLEIQAEGKYNSTVFLQCPILATSTTAAQGASTASPALTGRSIIPKEVLNILENGQEFTLLSLNPSPETKNTNTFNGYSVLGKITIQNAGERRSILNALYGGIALNGPEAMCFNPRLGIHTKMGNQVEDLVICFECGQIYFHGVSEGKIVVNASPASTLNRILSAASIPISK